MGMVMKMEKEFEYGGMEVAVELRVASAKIYFRFDRVASFS